MRPIGWFLGAALLGVLGVGTYSGLLRLGWVPGPMDLMLYHGPIVLFGFFGGLIGWERATHVGRWAYLAPVLAVAGSLLLAATWVGLAAAAFLGMFLVILAGCAIRFRKTRTPGTAVMGFGALAGAISNGMALYGALASWWSAFLVLALVGYRLEQAGEPRRIGHRSALPLVGALAGVVLGAVATPVIYDLGLRVQGAALALLALWLILAERGRLGATPWGRYARTSRVAAWGWLGLSGVLWLGGGTGVCGPFHDALMHAFYLGFAVSLLLAYLPELGLRTAGRGLRGWVWITWLLFQGTVLGRVLGNFTVGFSAEVWGSLANAVAMGLILVVLAVGRGVRRIPRRGRNRREEDADELGG